LITESNVRDHLDRWCPARVRRVEPVANQLHDQKETAACISDLSEGGYFARGHLSPGGVFSGAKLTTVQAQMHSVATAAIPDDVTDEIAVTNGSQRTAGGVPERA
jgi:hypothetical protein